MDKSEERENSHKKLAILALLLALLALALGFGAFSKTVDIQENHDDDKLNNKSDDWILQRR